MDFVSIRAKRKTKHRESSCGQNVKDNVKNVGATREPGAMSG